MRTHLSPPGLLVFLALQLVTSGLAQADEAAELRVEFGAAYQAADWPRAIRAGERLIALDPGSSAMHYNMACALSRSGHEARAVASLVRAGETGFSYVTTFRTDPDLASLRDLPGYERALALVLANHEVEFAAFKERAAKTEPLISAEGLKKRPAPLIVALHGRGGRAEGVFEAWKAGARRAGAVLVAPQSLDPFGEGFQWLKVDEAEHLVLVAIEQATAKEEIDRDRIIVTGFSQGGYVAFLMGARHPELFAGVIPIGAYTDAAVPIPESDGRMPRYQIIVGDEDEVLEGCRASADQLKEAGLSARLRVIEGLGHTLPERRVLGRALKAVLN